LLSIFFLLLKVFDSFFTFDALVNCISQCCQVEDLTLCPVVDINIGVLEITCNFTKVGEDLCVIGVCHDKLIGVEVSVVLQVHVLVALGSTMQVLVRLDRVELGAHHLGSLALDLIQ
jgi:hypothetical protein